MPRIKKMIQQENILNINNLSETNLKHLLLDYEMIQNLLNAEKQKFEQIFKYTQINESNFLIDLIIYKNDLDNDKLVECSIKNFQTKN